MNGMSKELIDIANGDIELDSKPKAIYKETDTVEQMARQTADLLADSARRLIASAQKDEQEILNIFVNKTYIPKRLVIKETTDYVAEMRNRMNVF